MWKKNKWRTKVTRNLGRREEKFQFFLTRYEVPALVGFQSQYIYTVYRIWRWRVDAHVTLGERAVGRQVGKDAGVCGDAQSRAETVLVREFTSIFISTRRQLFTAAAGTELRTVRRIRTEYEGRLNGVTMSIPVWKGENKNRERITYVWEKTGGFGVVQKRLRRPIMISRGDTPFWLTATLRLKRHYLI